MSNAVLITQAHLQQAMERSKTFTEDKVSDLSASAGGHEVGDIVYTQRTNLSDDYVLCNGEAIPASKAIQYDDMAVWSTSSFTVDPTATSNSYSKAVVAEHEGLYVAVWNGKVATASDPFGEWTITDHSELSVSNYYYWQDLKYINGWWIATNSYYVSGNTTGTVKIFYTKDPNSTWAQQTISLAIGNRSLELKKLQQLGNYAAFLAIHATAERQQALSILYADTTADTLTWSTKQIYGTANDSSYNVGAPILCQFGSTYAIFTSLRDNISGSSSYINGIFKTTSLSGTWEREDIAGSEFGITTGLWVSGRASYDNGKFFFNVPDVTNTKATANAYVIDSVQVGVSTVLNPITLPVVAYCTQFMWDDAREKYWLFTGLQSTADGTTPSICLHDGSPDLSSGWRTVYTSTSSLHLTYTIIADGIAIKSNVQYGFVTPFNTFSVVSPTISINSAYAYVRIKKEA